jgi:HAE1 family hydrophobic/amphiphilic exporter-1
MIVLTLFGLIFSLSVYIFWDKVERGEFFRWMPREEMHIWVDAPRGVTLETLDNIVRGFERRIENEEIPCDVQTVVNSRQAYGHINVQVDDKVKYSVLPYILKEKLVSQAVNYAGVGIYIAGFGLPYYNGGYRITTFYNTRLQITGPQYDKLQEICQSILKIAKQDPRVNQGVISPSLRNIHSTDLKEIALVTSMFDIWEKGWTYKDLIGQVKFWFKRRMYQYEVPFAQDRKDFIVTMGGDVPKLENIKKAVLTNPIGEKYRVENIFKSSGNPVSMWIDKENQQYRFTLAWEYRGPERMRARHERRVVNAITLPPGYRLVEKEWGFLTKKEEKDLLKLLIVVMVGTFMILAALYESLSRPFVIFMSVPFSLTGVFISYYLFQRNFNINGYIGLVLLTGIVVNNSIILVDRISQIVKQKSSLSEAIVRGSMERIRPIFITTFTTIGGLIPLFLMGTKESFISDIMEELSFITVSGMLSSTLLTITLVPIFYFSVEKLNPPI